MREYRDDDNNQSNVAPGIGNIALPQVGETPRSADKYQQMTLRDTPMANDGKLIDETPRYANEN